MLKKCQRFAENEYDSFSDGSDALPLVAGIVYFSPIFAERVMSLHLIEPLDAATYLGQDTGKLSSESGFGLFVSISGSVVPILSLRHSKALVCSGFIYSPLPVFIPSRFYPRRSLPLLRFPPAPLNDVAGRVFGPSSAFASREADREGIRLDPPRQSEEGVVGEPSKLHRYDNDAEEA